MKRDALLGRLAMFFVVFSWGFAFVAVKYLLNSGWSPVQAAVCAHRAPRADPGAVCAAGAAPPLGPTAAQATARHDRARFLPLLLLAFSHRRGPKTTTAAVAGLLAVVSPLLALGLSALLKLERFTPLKGAGALVSVCGVAVVVLFGRGQAADLTLRSLLGPLLIILGVSMVGMYNTLIRRFQDDFSALEASALTAVWPALLGLIPALLAWRTRRGAVRGGNGAGRTRAWVP